MIFSLINILQVLSVIAGITVLGILLKFSKYNPKGFGALAAFLCLDMLLTFYDLALLNGVINPIPHWWLLLSAISCSYPMLLMRYLASLSVIRQNRGDLTRLLIAPGLCVLLFIGVNSAESIALYHAQWFKQEHGPYLFYGALSCIYCAVVLYSLARIDTQEKHVRYFLLGTKCIAFTYLGNALSFLVMGFLEVSNDVLAGIRIVLAPAWFASIYFLLISVVYFLPFRRETAEEEEPQKEPDEGEEQPVPLFNLISEGQCQALLTQLDQLLDEKKVFMDARLQVNDMAEQLGVSERVLRTVLRHYRRDNLKALINQRRVAYVRQQIDHAREKPNFLDIAFEAGFNSKATFNRVFRQITGQSPTDYYEQASIQSPYKQSS